MTLKVERLQARAQKARENGNPIAVLFWGMSCKMGRMKDNYKIRRC
jgi:hypothetical protein